jgi:hypothetical protein
MTENVFIAWGRNLDLAERVASRLRAEEYFPTVGGRDRGSHPTTFFINSNVISQMDNAAFAIVLAQRIYDSAGQPTTEFRPNLMFEWGYLQRRLRADMIHIFLIGLKRHDLPSDLLNAYASEIDLRSSPSVKALDAAAKKIVETFCNNVVNIDLDGLDIIKRYDDYRSRLSDILDGRHSFNSRETGYWLLHMLQPAFYRDDLAFLQDCVNRLTGRATGHFSKVMTLVTQVVNYYEVADNNSALDVDGSNAKPASRKDAITKLHLMQRRLQGLSGSKDHIYNIFDVVLEDFRGLVHLALYKLQTNPKDLKTAIACFKMAKIECSEFQSDLAGNNFIRKYWLAYIHRNLSRAYFLAGNTAEGRRHARYAQDDREWVSSQLEAVGQQSMAQHFQLECALAKFDEVVHRRRAEADLLEIVHQYVEPYAPSTGRDRVWALLLSGLRAVAKAKRMKALASRLKRFEA